MGPGTKAFFRQGRVWIASLSPDLSLLWCLCRFLGSSLRYRASLSARTDAEAKDSTQPSFLAEADSAVFSFRAAGSACRFFWKAPESDAEQHIGRLASDTKIWMVKV